MSKLFTKNAFKKYANERNVCLPFPYPLKTTNGSVIWPFNQKGFALFEGSVCFGDKCVHICDQTSVIALHNMGFFGNTSGKPCDDSSAPKTTTAGKHVDTKGKSRREPKYLNGKYVLTPTSLEMALSEDIFSDNKCLDESDKCEAKPSTSSQDTGTDDQSKSAPNVLKLSFTESFFLSYVFGSLNVLNTETNNYMTIDEMWETFGDHYSEDKLEFAVHYSAYHYFRSKGWVVRNGTTFGTHLLLYKEGPHLYHSLYSVIIELSIDGQYKRPLDWFYMSALVRLQRNVRKELLVCVVNIAKDCDI
ncbi:unnamed protein product, partial [Medioppia subpectinata]